MKNIIIAFFCLAVVSSCNFFGPSFQQTWHVTKIDAVAGDQETEPVFTDAFISFYDHGVASFFNKNEHDRSLGAALFRDGQYTRADNELTFTLRKTTIDLTFTILEHSGKWLIHEIVKGPKESIGTQLKCQPSDVYQSSSFDLLDPKNNTWRQKADHKETKEEIKQRVVGHLNYLINYFDLVEHKSQGYFETAILQSPIGFYSNGIALPNDFASDNKWSPYFYDEEDATSGGKMLSQGLSSIEEYPADSKSYTKGYYNALKLIREHVEK